MVDNTKTSVSPSNLTGNGLHNPFTNTKKYAISCGSCGHGWKEKTSTDFDNVSVKCPCCGEINKFTHSAFARSYDRCFGETE